jgi:hypothetical protein
MNLVELGRKAIAFTACALAAAAASGDPGRVETLVTVNYVVRIEIDCPEGEVSCDRVRYHATHRHSDKSIELRGRTLHRPCADGVMPCRFLGYVFKRGEMSYVVLESGTLLVRRGERTLVDEPGIWD